MFRRDMVEDTNISALVVSKGVRSNNTSGCTGVYQEKDAATGLHILIFKSIATHLVCILIKRMQYRRERKQNADYMIPRLKKI